MTELLQSVGGWGALLAVVLVYGFFPGVFARLISLCFHRDDPRRKELIAEVYAVPRWERPIWVAEQLERALSEGVWERIWDAADGRLFNRWELGDGAARHAEYPDSFEVPTSEDIGFLIPGDSAKLMFDVKGRRGTIGKAGCQGERMWVHITKVDGDHFEGYLNNQPVVWNHLNPGDVIKFSGKHIIDVNYRDDEEAESAA